jgi:hypothetical protein
LQCISNVYNIIFGTFIVKNGLDLADCPTPLLFSSALEYVIGKVQAKQKGLKLSGTYQVLTYANDANILGGTYIT